MASQEEPHTISSDIKRAIDYIQQNITLDFSLEQLADIAILSCSQFKQKFKKQIGMTPNYYINRQKIEYSKALLLEGKSSTEISMLLNFSSSSYFSQAFQKACHLTPQQFRKQKNQFVKVIFLLLLTLL